ncbi:MAG: extracellular solute-binding protein [Chloroflexi bacterium]|nr:extracellular solute-binding protein [Chloroflexota bacterium]
MATRLRATVALWLALLLTACSLFPGPEPVGLPTAEATPTTSPALLNLGTPAASEITLRLWLPVSFRADEGSPGGAVLRDRLHAFELANPGVRIDVRLRADSGPGGLRDMLGLAAGAAPEALPDVVALDQPSLHAAALKGLIQPLPADVQPEESAGWFAFVAPLATVDGRMYGIPFVADCLVLAQREPASLDPPQWKSLTTWDDQLHLPLADPSARMLLLAYHMAGGELPASASSLALDADELERSLAWLRELEERGVLSPGSLQLATPELTLLALQTRGRGAVTSFSALATATRSRSGLSGSLPPTPSTQASTLVTGWAWATTAVHGDRAQRATRLLAWLSDAEFLGEWTHAQGMLPTRQGALAAWPADFLSALAGECAKAGEVQPSEEVLVSLGPLLNRAARQVLLEGASPHEAAQAAAAAIHP